MSKKETKFDTDKEIDIVLGFLKDIQDDAERIRLLFEQLKILRKHSTLKQVEKFHEILKLYECFVVDTEINGERIKKIADYLKKKGKKDIEDKRWLDILENEERWNFDW